MIYKVGDIISDLFYSYRSYAIVKDISNEFIEYQGINFWNRTNVDFLDWEDVSLVTDIFRE
jgi:hypothetical protein